MIRFYDRESLRDLVEVQGFTVEDRGDVLGVNRLIARAGTSPYDGLP
jgi:hypothetical protein